MTKHNFRPGAYSNHHSRNYVQPNNISSLNPMVLFKKFAPEIYKCAEIFAKKFRITFKPLMEKTVQYLWMGYTKCTSNYLGVSFLFGVLLLSLLLPNISDLLHKNSELKAMTKVVHDMSNEVKRAEVDCLTTAEKIFCLHCSRRDEETETKQDLRDLSTGTSRGLVVTQSEPVQVEKKIGFLRRIFTLNRNISKKEIIIMSVLYTDSFDSQEMTDAVSCSN